MATPTYADFLADPQRIENTTVELYPIHTQNFTEPDLFFCSHPDGYGTLTGETPSAQQFSRRLIAGYEREAGSIGPDGGGRFLSGTVPQVRGGSFALAIDRGDMDLGDAPPELAGEPLRRYAFGGRRVVVKHGGDCAMGRLPYSAYRTLCDGEVEGQPVIRTSDAIFKVRGAENRFAHPIQERTFFGTDLCLVGDGTDDAVDCGTDATYNFTAASFKWEFLIWIEAAPANAEWIVCRGLFETDGYEIILTTSGEIRFRTNQAGASQSTISEALPVKKWVRVSVLRIGAACTIYFDGNDSTDTAGTHTNPLTSARSLYFLRDDAGTGTAFLNALIDDIRVATTGLTEDDIDEQIHRPLDALEALDTLGYWKCDDAAGTTLADASPTGTDGTIAGGAVFGASCMGRADKSGHRMPMVFGTRRGITPILVDVGRQIYCVHSGPSQAIDYSSIRVGGSVIYTAGTAYTNFITFCASTATPNADSTIDTYIGPNWTLFRIGGQPQHPLTVDMSGDATGGTFRETAADLIRFIVCTYGPNPLTDPTHLNTTSFSDFETAAPYEMNLSFADDRTILQVIDYFLLGSGGTAWFDNSTGQLNVMQVGDPSGETAVATLTENDVERGTLAPLESGTPYWKVNVDYDECPTLLGAGQLLEEVIEEEPDVAEFHKSKWRRVSFERPNVRRFFKDAPEYTIQTPIREAADARVEAKRLSRLLKRPDQGFTFFCPTNEVELDYMDVVVFDYGDLDSLGRRQNRFGTSSTTKFYVRAIRQVPGRGGFHIDLWRPEAP